MKIILFQPQIPQNTGNIIRTCAVTGSELLLVRPLGFSVTDRWLKRAGLDYFASVPFQVIDDLDAYLASTDSHFYFFSSKAQTYYTQASYRKDDCLIFGSETDGLPDRFLMKWKDRFLKIPMQPNQRCLNLATSAGIAIYEAWRQLGFATE